MIWNNCLESHSNWSKQFLNWLKEVEIVVFHKKGTLTMAPAQSDQNQSTPSVFFPALGMKQGSMPIAYI